MKLSQHINVVGLLVFGTACSLLAKIIYYVEGPSIHGGTAKFEKPWFSVFAMFVGMSACVLLDLPKRRQQRGHALSEAEKEPLVEAHGERAARERHGAQASVWIINAPTLFDLFATACGTTGLLYTSVSVYQMLRGAMLVFTALLSVLFLKSKLTPYNYSGIALCCSGIALVGLANILAEDNPADRNTQAFGVAVILLGQVLQAGQVVIEEYLLRDLRMSAVRVVAWEGVFGVAHMLGWVMPLLYLVPGRDHGRLEDSVDSFYMVVHTAGVVLVLSLDMTMMLLYNVCGMGVTENLSAVHRVVIETLRTLFVWIIDIFAYYVITRGGFGEPWTPYSFIQLAGFLLLVSGTLLYNYEQLIADFRSSPSAVAPSPSATIATPKPDTKYSATPTTRPIALDDNDHYDEDGGVEDGGAEHEQEAEEHVGSFYGHTVGSASHSSFLAAGATPGSATGSWHSRRL